MIFHIIQEAYDGEDGYDACEEHFGHVHVVEEVDQLLAAWRAIVLTRLKRSTMKQNVWQSLCFDTFEAFLSWLKKQTK